MTKSKKQSKWSNFKLKASLFRIWFMKNILVWLQIILIVCLVLILTGNITENTPILGTLIYPIFGELIEEIKLITEEKEITGLMDFFAAAISVLMSVAFFALKAKNIAQADIKSDKLKIALIQANLYFNENCKLVKKTEQMVGKDLDGDGVIEGHTVEVTSGGLISGIVTAVKDFSVIASADFSGTDEEDEIEYTKAVQDAGLIETEKALKEIDKTVELGLTNMVLDKTIKKLDEKQTEISKNKDMTVKERVDRVSFITKIKNFFANLKKKKNEEAEEDSKVEIVVNNIEKHAEVKKEEKQHVNIFEKLFKKKEKTETKKDIKKETSTVVEQPKTKVDSDINNFLEEMRKRKGNR